MIPQSYDEWRHCITQECRIALSAEYITARLLVWHDDTCEETRRFRRLYGDAHWLAVRGWFERAAGDMPRTD